MNDLTNIPRFEREAPTMNRHVLSIHQQVNRAPDKLCVSMSSSMRLHGLVHPCFHFPLYIHLQVSVHLSVNQVLIIAFLTPSSVQECSIVLSIAAPHLLNGDFLSS